MHHKLHAFARAARISGEQDAGHEEAGEDAVCLPAPVPLPLLKQRADKMFSGATGAAVASGDGEATSAPSLQLVKDIVDVIFALEKARPELFHRLAKQRPCGLLDKYGASGMLLCDVLGLPLLPWALAEPIGKAAAKLPAAIAAEVKKAKKRAARAGRDSEAAAQAVLLAPVKLPLPTADEITAAARRAAPAPPPSAPPPREPTPTLAPTPTPEPAAMPVAFPFTFTAPAAPAPAPAPAPEPAPRQLREGEAFANEELMELLKHSQAMGRAIIAACEFERYIPEPIDVDATSGTESESDSEEDDAAEHAMIKYKHALRRIDKAFPKFRFNHDTTGAPTEENSTRCPCGEGRKGQWPWLLQPEELGNCGECLGDVWRERGEWVTASGCDQFR